MIIRRTNKMATEAFLAQKMTAYANELFDTQYDPAKTKYFKYLSENDSRVRKLHLKYDNIILPTNDPFWTTTAKNLLQQWNCRCHISEVLYDVDQKELEDSRSRSQTLKKIEPDKKDIMARDGNMTLINQKDNKVIVFKQNNTIKDMPNILRKRYAKKYE